MTDGYTPIPDCPGYSISPLGQVRSDKSGLLLRHDPQGRVRIQHPDTGRRRLFFVGELLPAPPQPGDLAPASTPAAGAPESPPAAIPCPERERLALARRANGHLLALVAELRRHISRLESAAPAKKGRKPKAPKPHDASILSPLDFGDNSEWEVEFR